MDEQDNSTNSPPEVFYSYTYRQMVVAFILVLSILGTFGNMLVIAAVILSKKLWHVTNMFVLNLSIVDLLICVYVIPMNAVVFFKAEQSPTIKPFCTIAGLMFVLCFGCSINNLMCIAISRYAIIRLNGAAYAKLFSQRRTALAIGMTWLIPMFGELVPTLTGCLKPGYDEDFSACNVDVKNTHKGCAVIVLFSIVPVQFCVLFWSCAMVFRHIRTHAKRVQHLEAPIEMQVHNAQRIQQPRPNTKLQVEVSKNLLLVVCAFIVCILPATICSLLLFTLKDNTTVRKVMPGTIVILSANSCLNPMIYGFKHPHFKTVFNCILRGRFDQIPDRNRICK
ncbi:melatonin receptor type 1C-like [Acanthaster planci]|uniref:Melatonin receptor type 1C-like n=1 Tax=Acanthaster planci TaxID=133434 RepID=A0A8B7XYH9_ACAPL|nr:melatonin receptor type 1C-like [Acanthaster planci]